MAPAAKTSSSAGTLPPTLNELRALATALPPSERATSSEVADLTSALAAFVTYGTGIIDAAQQGAPAVADFIHAHLTDKADAAGDPAPQRGNVTQVAPDAAVAASAPAIDYDKLAAAIVKAQAE